jgi:hypothetical protein
MLGGRSTGRRPDGVHRRGSGGALETLIATILETMMNTTSKAA